MIVDREIVDHVYADCHISQALGCVTLLNTPSQQLKNREMNVARTGFLLNIYATPKRMPACRRALPERVRASSGLSARSRVPSVCFFELHAWAFSQRGLLTGGTELLLFARLQEMVTYVDLFLAELGMLYGHCHVHIDTHIHTLLLGSAQGCIDVAIGSSGAVPQSIGAEHAYGEHIGKVDGIHQLNRRWPLARAYNDSSTRTSIGCKSA